MSHSDSVLITNVPDNGEHESLDAGDSKMVVGLLGLILEDVLHYEYHVLDEHRVYVAHNRLPVKIRKFS